LHTHPANAAGSPIPGIILTPHFDGQLATGFAAKARAPRNLVVIRRPDTPHPRDFVHRSFRRWHVQCAPNGVWCVRFASVILEEEITMAHERKGKMSIEEMEAALKDLPAEQLDGLFDRVLSDRIGGEDEIDPAILAEARRRLDDMKAGRVMPVPFEQLLDDLDRLAS
jgi:hypothetical protein